MNLGFQLKACHASIFNYFDIDLISEDFYSLKTRVIFFCTRFLQTDVSLVLPNKDLHLNGVAFSVGQ